MIISTVLLIADLLSLLIEHQPLFSFWHLLWIYPLEIIVWFLYMLWGMCEMAKEMNEYDEGWN